MDRNIAAELSKYSKEALINAFINNNLFGAEDLLRNVKHEEFNIIVEKQKELSDQMRNLDWTKDFKKYHELNAKYMRYNKQTDKLLDL